MLAAERHQHLLDKLGERGAIQTTRVARELGVSQMTIRRDLVDLEHRGLLRRVHGGAQTPREADVGYGLRAKRSPRAKQQLGKLAAGLARSHETIYLDAGTTCMEVARALKRRDLRNVNLLTHAVNIATELAGQPGFTVIQVGGELYGQTYAATGPTALATIEQFAFDRMFLAAQGLHPKFGLTNSNLREVEIKLAAMRRSSWVGLVLDSSKWRRQALARIAALNEISAVISDGGLPAEARKLLEGAGLEVIAA